VTSASPLRAHLVVAVKYYAIGHGPSADDLWLLFFRETPPGNASHHVWICRIAFCGPTMQVSLPDPPGTVTTVRHPPPQTDLTKKKKSQRVHNFFFAASQQDGPFWAVKLHCSFLRALAKHDARNQSIPAKIQPFPALGAKTHVKRPFFVPRWDGLWSRKPAPFSGRPVNKKNAPWPVSQSEAQPPGARMWR